MTPLLHKRLPISRRTFLLSLSSLCAATAAHAFWLEPHWIRTRTVSLAEHPRWKILHCTDLHFKGDSAYDLGLYHTPKGPLYVGPGLGTFHLQVRMFCRPELTLLLL